MWFRKSRPLHRELHARPTVEQLETRDVPALFLQGQVYFDANANGTFDIGEAGLDGAKVSLFAAGNIATPIAEQIVGVDGGYRFVDLAEGNYRLVQMPPDGYANLNADVSRWSLGGATAIQPKTIDVQLNASSYQLALIGNDNANIPNTPGRSAGTYLPIVTTLAPPFTNTFPGNPQPYWHLGGQIGLALSGTNLSSTPFVSYCLDLGHSLGTSATVNPLPGYFNNLPSNVTFPGVEQAGRIAYLYNHYGAAGFTGAGADVKAAALQIALWELAYDNVSGAGGTLADQVAARYLENGNHIFNWIAPGAPVGNFANNTTLTNAVRTQAYTYLAESVGKNEAAIFLDGPSTGNQLVIASGSLDFGNVTAATISGTKFTDLTGNGLSTDDTPLAGTTINLYAGASATGAVIQSVTTAAETGAYSFTGLAPGTYFVQEAVPEGYTQTGGLSGYVVHVGTATDAHIPVGGTAVDRDFANFKNIAISGTKFTDVTGNGFSADDTTLGSVSVRLYREADTTAGLSAGDALVTAATTAPDGSYHFADLGPGTYYVEEVLTGEYVQTGGPNFYTVEATSGTDVANRNFANFKKLSISGTKFNDVTGNSFSSDDTPLVGVTINLYKDGTFVTSATTAADGSYSFPDLGPGTYFVQEVVPTGSVQTAGNTGYTVTATSGENSTGNDFANFEKITISGRKVEDITGNGFSTDDTGWVGVTINLYRDDGDGVLTAADGAAIATTVSAASGSYSFADLGPGTYFVEEFVPAGSVRTGGPAYYTVTSTSGIGSTDNHFANFKQITVAGTKYADLTGNNFSSDDTPLPGVTIELYKNGTYFASTVTDNVGGYSFTGLGPGTYVVKEVLTSGYVQTGGLASYTIPAISGADSLGNDFANFKQITITGIKFKDITGNSFSSDDTPLPGVTIELYKDGGVVGTATTGADGSYSFPNLGPGTYFVQEVLPSGYRQTGGNAGYTIPATSGSDSVDNNFANELLVPGIDIEKTTNGATNTNATTPGYDNEDTPTGAGVPVLTPGTTVTWTYQVTNTGNVAFATGQISIVDDNGTTAAGDDLSIANGQITFLSEQTGDGDALLEPGEVWLYKATGTVLNFTTAGATVDFTFGGSSPLSGTAGNVQMFTAGGVSVAASAFSRDGSGAWAPAYLGRYSGGLGVTDSSEGDGSNNTHTVDNSGRNNYVVFEFSETVIVDSVFLGYVVGDSDLTVWIGTKTDPFSTRLALDGAKLAALGFTEVNLGGSSTRWADLNAGGVAGNVLIVAAKAGDSDDKFKIEKLKVQKVSAGVYANTAVVTVPGGTDSDLSHYKNPTAPVGGSISGTKYRDVSGNGLNVAAGANSPADVPLAGVAVYLDANNNKVLDPGEASTSTDANGNYLFAGLTPGAYYVREVVPEGWLRTGPALSDVYAVTVTNGTHSTGNNFANFETVCSECTFENVSYKIVHADGTSEVVYDLRGQTQEGDLITVTFTIGDPGSFVVSFVSYTAPDPFFSASTAGQQQIYDLASGTFSNGQTGSLTISVPNSYYQVDFVCGYVIDRLGPAGSNIFYTPQGRLLSADNGGTHAPVADPGSISGVKYKDADGDGFRDDGEAGLGKWVIYLDVNDNGVRDAGERATVTREDGSYRISNVPAGNYKVREVQQAGWTATQTPATVALAAGQNKTGADFGNKVAAAGSVSGYKFNDRNADGEWDKNGLDNCWNSSDDEVGMSGWTVFVDYDRDGSRDANEPYDVTDSSGYYKIIGVATGTWDVVEVMQSGWVRTTAERRVTLSSGEAETNVNFGNFRGSLVMSGDTATVGFWRGSNGQALIKKLNGGSTSTALGNWLATNFPEMYGSGCGSNNMAGKTNAQIATYFCSLANNSAKQLEAQVLATALAVYVTDCDWAGGNYAASYGFNVSSTGVKNDYYNIGDSGAAFGVANDSALTVMDILRRTNDRARDGSLWYGYSSSIKLMATSVYAGINADGGITG